MLSKAEGKSFVTALGMWLSNASTLKVGDYRVIKGINAHDKIPIYTIGVIPKKIASIAGSVDDEAA